MFCIFTTAGKGKTFPDFQPLINLYIMKTQNAIVKEKFVTYGAESLSDGELVNFFVNKESQYEKIQTAVGNKGLRGLARLDWKTIKYRFDIAEGSALMIKALFDFSRRYQLKKLDDRIQITCPQDAVVYFAPGMRDLAKEVFVVAFLNNAKIIDGYKKISSGGSTATIVDPAEVIRQAIVNEASSILLLHNHPSGHRKESRADVKLTQRLNKAGKLLGIPVEDHIIIAGDGFTSLKTKGVL
jgi:DNA repair protein RadC